MRAAVTLMLKVLDGSDPSSSKLTTIRTKIDTKCLLATNKNIRIGQLAD